MVDIGLVVIFGIILVPVYVFIAASFIGKPRNPRTTIIFLAIPVAILIGAVVGAGILSAILGLFVP